jgi:hypothetical protein
MFFSSLVWMKFIGERLGVWILPRKVCDGHVLWFPDFWYLSQWDFRRSWGLKARPKRWSLNPQLVLGLKQHHDMKQHE